MSEPRLHCAAPMLEDFPFRAADSIRFGDTDQVGHVNNAVFATFCETGRAKLLLEAGCALQMAGAIYVTARLELDFLVEMHWPGQVQIGTRIARIGRSSFTLEHGLFQDGRCTATARSVLVLIDEITRRPRPLPVEAVVALERLLAGEGGSMSDPRV